jgi:hypothetical protein
MNALRTAHRIGLKGCSTRRGVVYRCGLPAQRGFASTAPTLASLSNWSPNLIAPPPGLSAAGASSPTVSASTPASYNNAGVLPSSTSTGSPAPSNNAGALSRSGGSASGVYQNFQRDWDVVTAGLKESAMQFHEAVAANQERIAALETRREEHLASVKAFETRLEEQHKESVKALAEHRHYARLQRKHDREAMKEIQRRQLEARTGTQALHDSLQDLRTALFDFVLHAKNQEAMYSRTLARLEPAPAKQRVKEQSAAVEKAVMAKVSAEKGLRLSEQLVEETAVKPAKALGERIAAAFFWLTGPMCLLFGLTSYALAEPEQVAGIKQAFGGGASSGGASGASRSGGRSASSAKAPMQAASATPSSSAKDAAIVTGGLAAAVSAEQAARRAAAEDKANSSKPATKTNATHNEAPRAPPALGTRSFLVQALPTIVPSGLDTVIPVDRVVSISAL